MVNHVFFHTSLYDLYLTIHHYISHSTPLCFFHRILHEKLTIQLLDILPWGYLQIIHFFHWDFPSTPPFLATSIMTSRRGAGSAPASKASRSRASSTCSTHCSNSAARSWSPWLARCLGTVGRSWDGLKGGDVYGDWTKICDFNGEWTIDLTKIWDVNGEWTLMSNKSELKFDLTYCMRIHCKHQKWWFHALGFRDQQQKLGSHLQNPSSTVKFLQSSQRSWTIPWILTTHVDGLESQGQGIWLMMRYWIQIQAISGIH